MVWAFFVPSRSWEARATDIFGGALETRREQTGHRRRGVPAHGDKVAKGYGSRAAWQKRMEPAMATSNLAAEPGNLLNIELPYPSPSPATTQKWQ